MTRTASLPMYAAGSLANAALWAGLRPQFEDRGFTDVPKALTEDSDHTATWYDPNLLLSQTCGYPLCRELKGKVRYVGTPVYDVPGTEGAYYSSVLVARRDDPGAELADFRDRRAAYNSTHSQSGYNAFRHRVAPLASNGFFFAHVTATGSHAASLRAVIADKADIAAIDAVSLSLEPGEIRNAIKIVGWTDRVPSLPYITAVDSSDKDVNLLRESIGNALVDAALAEPLAYLKLSGFEILPETAYDAVLAMERDAVELGYPLLA
jgi:ABC-type phosphate/phosphonate transport system substrate-binding protein